jgi:hypothetical protein
LVVTLLEIIAQQQTEIHQLKDEIAQLKGVPPRPKIKPSQLEGPRPSPDPTAPETPAASSKRRRPGRGWTKRHLTAQLTIHATEDRAPEAPPAGSRFKGYRRVVVRDLELRAHNTLYRLQRWQTPDGQELVGQLPSSCWGHFGPMLVSFILYQHYHALVTQPLLLEQLHEFGITISAGQLNRLLIDHQERYHAEKAEILRVGLAVSRHIQVDDTGARHQGRNGYCTYIGNDWFAWFESTPSKSRINFLELLRAGRTDYCLSEPALAYMRAEKLPQAQLNLLSQYQDRQFPDRAAWLASLAEWGITQPHHLRIATEGALLGSVLHGDLHPELAILSDDAGQFNLLRHALCWVHAERTILKLQAFTTAQRQAIEGVRTQIWELYDALKAYKEQPSAEQKSELEQRFDQIFSQETGYSALDAALARLLKNKAELLLVLDRPDIPLHNNQSESDIREYVKRRKISGSTRSDLGRQCRDTFAALKKTCRKLGISFWEYLKARVSGSPYMSPLPELMKQRAAEGD